MSTCLLKQQHAEFGCPCPSATALPFDDWVSMRVCLAEIMDLARCSSDGVERLTNIKRVFRARFQLELSETLLGYTKLSDLLHDPVLVDLCSVELRSGGYVVVP